MKSAFSNRLLLHTLAKSSVTFKGLSSKASLINALKPSLSLYIPIWLYITIETRNCYQICTVRTRNSKLTYHLNHLTSKHIAYLYNHVQVLHRHRLISVYSTDSKYQINVIDIHQAFPLQTFSTLHKQDAARLRVQNLLSVLSCLFGIEKWNYNNKTVIIKLIKCWVKFLIYFYRAEMCMANVYIVLHKPRSWNFNFIS